MNYLKESSNDWATAVDWYVQEKIDGSQISFGYNLEKRELMVANKGRDVNSSSHF